LINNIPLKVVEFVSRTKIKKQKDKETGSSLSKAALWRKDSLMNLMAAVSILSESDFQKLLLITKTIPIAELWPYA
jgi:hypothetical protein